MIGLRHVLQSLREKSRSEGDRLVEAMEGHTEEHTRESEDGNEEDRQAGLEPARRKRVSMNPRELGMDKDLQKGEGDASEILREVENKEYVIDKIVEHGYQNGKLFLKVA